MVLGRRGQLGILAAVGSYVGFLVFFFVFLGSYLSQVGDVALANGATGIEAMFYAWLNLWVFIAATLGFLVYAGLSLRA